ncbi:hypothetical protein N7474_003183 [Penicillium riverlandense]|uniref:uncharacterized protein n=1 Tax=Penicillium riverlandense TaxID=1903569 RepID=UPI002547A1D7|nr:uncharacterized protein N7474_003183 [Penicillium riverlandense]KAJ5826045.1 hypothetical protein N7474_003183 [Penicillium riverlandense]
MASTNGVSVVISPPSNFDLDSYKLLNFNESFEQLFDRTCDDILSDQASLEASKSEDTGVENFSITSSDGVTDEPDPAGSASKKSRYVYVPSPRKIKYTYGKKGVTNRTITMIDILSDNEDEATQKRRKPSESNVDNFAGAEAPLVDMDNSALSSDFARNSSSSDVDVVEAEEIASLEPSNQDELGQGEDERSESSAIISAEPEELQMETTGVLGGSTDDAPDRDVKDGVAIEEDAILAGPASPPSCASMASAVPQVQPSATALSWQNKTDALFGKTTPEKKSVLAASSEYLNQDDLMQSEGEDEINQQVDGPDERASDVSSRNIGAADAEEDAKSERNFVDIKTLTVDNVGFSNGHTDGALNGDLKDEAMEEDAIFASLEPSKRDGLMQSIVSHPFMQEGGYPVVRSERSEFIDHISTEATSAGMDKMSIYLLIKYVRKLYLSMNSSLSDADIDALEGFEFGDERRKKRKRNPDRPTKKSKRKKRLLDNDDLPENTGPDESNETPRNSQTDMPDASLEDSTLVPDNLLEVEVPDHHSSSKAKRNKRKRARQKKKKADKHRESLSKAALREGTPPAKDVTLSTPTKSRGTPSKSPGSSRKSSHGELPADPGLWDVDF